MRIVIAEDDVLLREGLVMLLNSDGHEVVAVAGNGPDVPPALLEHRPDAAALDPDVVSQLTTSRRDPLRALTPREREVPGLMAQCLDNATIASTLVITERSVGRHIGAVFAKLGLPHTDSGHRRVLAVPAYLNS